MSATGTIFVNGLPYVPDTLWNSTMLCPERIKMIVFDEFWYTRREYSSVLFWDFRAGLLNSLGPVSEITCPSLIFLRTQRVST
jgi:hypothetical protein